MPRSVTEWIGKTDDTAVPRRVRLRNFLDYKGVCGICGIKIFGKRWITDHKVALINDGENRERNLWPIHEVCDRTVKTPRDVAEKSAVARVQMSHYGIRKRKSRPMPGSRDSGIKMKIGGGWERR
jgi:5-methylcytosine-specific restriction endonuclease McrA